MTWDLFGRFAGHTSANERATIQLTDLLLPLFLSLIDCSASNDPSNPSERLGNNNNINFWPMRDEKRTSHSATAVKGLPVLVRVGNYRSQTAMSTDDDNEMLVEANAKLASSLNAIVVDFEHRSGLLGKFQYSNRTTWAQAQATSAQANERA